MTNEPPRPTDAELEILTVLWSLGPATVREVHDVTLDPLGIERELALIKVRGKGEDRAEALRLADIFRAKVIDTSLESFVFELTGASSKIDQFVALMRPIGLVELSRTGVLSLTRGVG